LIFLGFVKPFSGGMREKCPQGCRLIGSALKDALALGKMTVGAEADHVHLYATGTLAVNRFYAAAEP